MYGFDQNNALVCSYPTFVEEIETLLNNLSMNTNVSISRELGFHGRFWKRTQLCVDLGIFLSF